MKIDTSRWLKHDLAACSYVMLLTVGIAASCTAKKQEDPLPLFVKYTPTFVSGIADTSRVFVVVEIPAGTSTLQAIDSSGEIRSSGMTVDFLPFPGNFGFVAGCGRWDTATGQLLPLPAMVMMDALQQESMIEVLPVATLQLRKESGPYPVIIAIPADSSLQSIRAQNFVDFITEYDAARHILQQWFLNYQGRQTFALVGWQDEHSARQLIADWKLKE